MALIFRSDAVSREAIEGWSTEQSRGILTRISFHVCGYAAGLTPSASNPETSPDGSVSPCRHVAKTTSVCVASVLLGMWHDETRDLLSQARTLRPGREQANVEESDRRTSESPQTLTNPSGAALGEGPL